MKRTLAKTIRRQYEANREAVQTRIGASQRHLPISSRLRLQFWSYEFTTYLFDHTHMEIIQTIEKPGDQIPSLKLQSLLFVYEAVYPPARPTGSVQFSFTHEELVDCVAMSIEKRYLCVDQPGYKMYQWLESTGTFPRFMQSLGIEKFDPMICVQKQLILTVQLLW